MDVLQDLTVEISRQSVHVIGIDAHQRRTVLARLPQGAAIPTELKVIVFDETTPADLMEQADVRIHVTLLCPNAWLQVMRLFDRTRVHPRVKAVFGTLMVLLTRDKH